MTRVVSFDMDGTLIAPEYTEWVWKHGVPLLYGEKAGLSFEAAKAFVEAEYEKVGEEAVEWYDIRYWLDLLELKMGWKVLLERYVDKLEVYPDARPILERQKNQFTLVLTSNAAREFIEVELQATGLETYFDRIFSATSDFGEVKKTLRCYERLCHTLGVRPGEVVHVGDHVEFDYVVPQRLGIRAFLLDRLGRHRGDSVLSQLGDLEGKL